MVRGARQQYMARDMSSMSLAPQHCIFRRVGVGGTVSRCAGETRRKRAEHRAPSLQTPPNLALQSDMADCQGHADWRGNRDDMRNRLRRLEGRAPVPVMTAYGQTFSR
ncbi:hypothetical protein ACJQWK_02942 [Exserohilum turcicum]